MQRIPLAPRTEQIMRSWRPKVWARPSATVQAGPDSRRALAMRPDIIGGRGMPWSMRSLPILA
jgi:hypothetical protein